MALEEAEFQFELNETLHFEDGYEVRELISISLEPEVSIDSYDTYISIRGEIELQGEYLRDGEETLKEPSLDLENFQTQRFIEKIELREDEIADFIHRFPVDISVPSYRVNSVDDIRIEMLTFDYDLPTNKMLKINAVATIHGMKAEIDLLEEKQSRETEVRENESKNEESELFEFELKPQEMNREKETTEVEEVKDEELRRKNSDVKAESGDESRSDIIELTEVEEEQGQTRSYSEEKEEVGEVENEIEVAEGVNREEELIDDVSYLTDMFRNEEEEKYSRMRICIVQEDDTIETIAERFQVSTLQLIKKNNLDEDYEVSEGQLLYIPKK